MSAFTSVAIGLGLHTAAYFGEIFRGGIISIDRGQWEAAKAIGMDRNRTLTRVILPQAVKRMIPAFLERAIELMKTTTLVSTISYSDLLFQANSIAQSTYRSLEVFSVAAALYFIVIFACSIGVRRIERFMARTGESTAH